MRKLFLSIVIGLLFVACEGPMGPQGEPGEPGYGTNWAVQFHEIYRDQWIPFVNDDDPNASYYRYTLTPKVYRELPYQEDREYVYNDGTLLVYWYPDFDGPNEVQILLPYWSGGYVGTTGQYSQSLSFEYTSNNITFYLYDSDPNRGPNDLTVFRTVFNW